MQTDPASLDPEERSNKFFALASAGLGLLSLCGGIISPAFGSFLAILGIVLGIFGRKSENKKSATVGIALSIIGLLTAIIFSVLLYIETYK
jgi:multisubunit Na+/H+ antiporter MnhG subunit